MYRIDTEKLENFKEATTSLLERLEEVRDTYVLQMGGLEEKWKGDGADSALIAGQEFTEQIEDEIATLKGLEDTLGYTLENARRLRVQSKKLVEILLDEESSQYYTGQGYRIGASIGDGVISLEESTVTQLVESCNHATEAAREIEDITYEIDDLMESMEYIHIDISDQTEKIRKDCKKVERLEEYGRGYRRYAEEFIELDSYLCKLLEQYQSEEKKGLTEMHLRRYNNRTNTVKKIDGSHTVSIEKDIKTAVMLDRSIPADQKGNAIDQRIRFFHALCILESDNATFEYVMEFDYIRDEVLYNCILLEAEEVSHFGQQEEEIQENNYSNENEGQYDFEYNWMKEGLPSSEYVTQEFLDKVVVISEELGIAPDDLMAVMAFESWLNPYAENSSGAYGLIQFTEIAIQDINRRNDTDYTKDDIKEMDAIQQLDLVRLHYLPKAGLMQDLGDVYLVTFAPAFVDGKDNEDDTVLYSLQETPIQYNANKGLDKENKGFITKGDAYAAVVNRRDEYFCE